MQAHARIILRIIHGKIGKRLFPFSAYLEYQLRVGGPRTILMRLAHNPSIGTENSFTSIWYSRQAHISI